MQVADLSDLEPIKIHDPFSYLIYSLEAFAISLHLKKKGQIITVQILACIVSICSPSKSS